jgi:hypothetical protein
MVTPVGLEPLEEIGEANGLARLAGGLDLALQGQRW